MTYLRRKPEDEVWYLHPPLKKGIRELVTVPPPSQIPYLNGVSDDQTIVNQTKPFYVQGTSSSYICQCKLCGKHDLLDHIDPATRKSKEPVPYSRPRWWDAMCEKIPSSSLNFDNKRQQNRKSSKTERVFDIPEWLVRSECNLSSDRQRNAVSRQFQLSTNTKRKNMR